MKDDMYTATIDGAKVADFPTVSAARAWAEDHGTTASVCVIRRGDRVVAEHRRDTSGDGRWFKAEHRGR